MLQRALEEALLEFPLYRCVLKRGMFWYYFETSSLPALVRDDALPPCAPLYDRTRRRLLFRVTHYETRINLEVHHTLADGTGAARFLCSLTRHYLLLRHPGELAGAPHPDYDASPVQKREDSFMKHYDPSKKSDRKKIGAYRLSGSQLPEFRMQVYEGVMSASHALTRARARGATLTAYLTAQWMIAISGDMAVRQKKKPVVITVPVNLRPYYHSQTARNFFATMDIAYDFRNSDALEDVLASVVADFKAELTPQKMAERMNQMISLETNVISRASPLPLKDFVMRIAGNNDKKRHTTTISNVGFMKLPEEFHPYIRRFSVIIATDGLQMCLNTFGDTLTLGITSAFVSSDIPRRFFRQLAADGIETGIATNLLSEREEGVL